MPPRGKFAQHRRAALLGCTILATIAGAATEARAQAAPAADQGTTTLQEIIVTAQKREQNLQSVPISISAVTAKTLEANRITNVMNLGAVAPNLTVRPSVGGVGIPTFSLRGVVSYGVVPGSDKSISLYVDGVYIGSATGSAFELPDVDRIEVLKGPQGTLFGRNATAGAVSIITRDPPGKFGVRQDFTFGNYNQFKSRTRIDFDTWHDLTGSINFVHDERQGDIKNLGAGTVWDYSGSSKAHMGVLTSPKYLGDKNANLIFATAKFKPTDNFTATNKFDWMENHYTPDGQGFLGFNSNPASLGPTIQGTLLALGNAPSLLQVYPTRPKALNNSFTTPAYQTVYGDSLTLQYRVNDNLSIKDIAAYRYSYIWANDQLDGLGGLSFGPGLPFEVLAVSSQSVAKQYSDELQVNFDSKYLTMTAGALYFQNSTRAGGPFGLANNFAIGCIPGGNLAAPVHPFCSPFIPATNRNPAFPGYLGDSSSFNRAKSYAGYVQLEGHLTSQLDIVGGYRLTKDDKSGSVDASGSLLSFTYQKTKPSYSIGLNYKPWDHMLLYAKYANAFVSGGSVGGLSFLPETAHSYEGGIKADFLDRRLRADLAVWDVSYQNMQQAASGLSVASINPAFAQLGTVVLDEGNGHATGFELELTALPMRGLTLTAGVGDTDFHFTKVNLANDGLAPVPGGSPGGVAADFAAGLRPKWTANLSAQYETEPLFDDVRLSLRTDASYRSSEILASYATALNPSFAAVDHTGPTWLVNARVALEHLSFAHTNVDVALWVQNLTDDKSPSFSLFLPLNPAFPYNGTDGATSYQEARTFGVDLSLTY